MLEKLRILTAEWACSAWRRAEQYPGSDTWVEYNLAHWLHLRVYFWPRELHTLGKSLRDQYENGIE